MKWTALKPRAEDLLGYIPDMISEADPRPAAQQFHAAYAHGGGWDPFKGFARGEANQLVYPGDPPIWPVATATLREEQIFVYPYAWVMILQPNGSFEVSRMD